MVDTCLFRAARARFRILRAFRTARPDRRIGVREDDARTVGWRPPKPLASRTHWQCKRLAGSRASRAPARDGGVQAWSHPRRCDARGAVSAGSPPAGHGDGRAGPAAALPCGNDSSQRRGGLRITRRPRSGRGGASYPHFGLPMPENWAFARWLRRGAGGSQRDSAEGAAKMVSRPPWCRRGEAGRRRRPKGRS